MKAATLTLAIALLSACSAAATSTPATAPTPVPVQLADFKITLDPTTLSGSTFAFGVTSSGPTPHNFNIRDDSGRIAGSMDLSTGESDTVIATLAPGSYTFYCAFPGHESLGMHGTLTVSR
jgi:plastocyanin